MSSTKSAIELAPYQPVVDLENAAVVIDEPAVPSAHVGSWCIVMGTYVLALALHSACGAAAGALKGVVGAAVYCSATHNAASGDMIKLAAQAGAIGGAIVAAVFWFFAATFGCTLELTIQCPPGVRLNVLPFALDVLFSVPLGVACLHKFDVLRFGTAIVYNVIGWAVGLGGSWLLLL